MLKIHRLWATNSKWHEATTKPQQEYLLSLLLFTPSQWASPLEGSCYTASGGIQISRTRRRYWGESFAITQVASAASRVVFHTPSRLSSTQVNRRRGPVDKLRMPKALTTGNKAGLQAT